jgi:hypothetical protein
MRYSRLAALAVLAGSTVSIAQPVLDGRLFPADQTYYGPAKFTQNQPTSFCDNTNVGCIPVGGGVRFGINNSNIAGVPGGGGALLDAATQTACAAVTTGLEIAIPVAQLGTLGSSIRITGWVNGGGSDYLSNQVIGGFQAAQGNLGGDGNGGFNGSVAIDWTTKAGDQFITLAVPGSIPVVAATIDGTRDASYPAPQFVETNETQFGNGTAGAVDCPGGGSEIANTSAMFGNADLGSGAQNYLFIFIGGNLECNFNRLNVVIDNGSGTGFNIIPSSCLPAADGLEKHVGMHFDAGFGATHYLSFRNGGAPFGIYSDFAQIQPGGSGGFIGGGGAAVAVTGTSTSCPPSDTASTGSELDQVFTHLDRATNRLNVMVTGNLKENIFLHLFFDTRTGGQNAILNNNTTVGIADGGNGHLGRFGPVTAGGPALTFDAAFSPDYWFASHFENGNRQVIDSSTLNTTGKDLVPNTSSSLDYGSYQGADAPNAISFDGTSTTSFVIAGGIQLQDGFVANPNAHFAARESRRVLENFITARGGYIPTPDAVEWSGYLTANPPTPGLLRAAFNNSNVAGVTDGSAAGAASASAGFEYSLDLAELGYAGGPLKLAGFIAGNNTTNVSSQVIGGSGQATNLGDPRNINFSTIAGNQYIFAFCPQDHNQNGVVTVQDIFDFLADYFSNNLQADYNYSGAVSVQDIFDFLAGYFSGNCL